MKKIKLDKNTWIVIGGVGSAVAAVVLLARGNPSAAAAASDIGAVDPNAVGGGSTTDPIFASLAQQIGQLNTELAALPHTTQDPIVTYRTLPDAWSPSVVDRPSYTSPPAAYLPPPTSPVDTHITAPAPAPATAPVSGPSGFERWPDWLLGASSGPPGFAPGQAVKNVGGHIIAFNAHADAPVVGVTP